MATRTYLAIVDRLPGEANWSITFPDFPCVTSVAGKFAHVVRQAKDALVTVVEEMERDGHSLPPAIEDHVLPDYDRSWYHEPRTLMGSVYVAGRAPRGNVSLDEGFLARIDDVAKRTGVSRSALLAKGARMIAMKLAS